MGTLTRVEGPIAEVVLDWPSVRNALGRPEARELRLAIEKIIEQDEAGAIVLAANGPAFCAGGNLPEIIQLAAQSKESLKDAIYGEFQALIRTIAQCPVPILSAVDGAAVGFGADLALCTSVTFIGEAGWIAQGWMKAGLIPATGGVLHTKRRGGPQTIWRMLAADKVDGPLAEEWGLAVACDNARAASLDLARKLGALPRGPLKAMVELSRIDALDAHLETALRHQLEFFGEPDFAERALRLVKR